MLRGADHVHDEDAGFVEALDYMGWGDADGGDEDLCAGVDGYGDEVVELAVGVVVICLASGAADLGQGEVDAKGEAFICEVCF